MFEKYDTVIGKSIGTTNNGTYVEIGEQRVVGWIKNKFIKKDSNVICTVSFVKSDGFPILSLDSVVYSDLVA